MKKLILALTMVWGGCLTFAGDLKVLMQNELVGIILADKQSKKDLKEKSEAWIKAFGRGVSADNVDITYVLELSDKEGEGLVENRYVSIAPNQKKINRVKTSANIFNVLAAGVAGAGAGLANNAVPEYNENGLITTLANDKIQKELAVPRANVYSTIIHDVDGNVISNTSGEMQVTAEQKFNQLSISSKYTMIYKTKL